VLALVPRGTYDRSVSPRASFFPQVALLVACAAISACGPVGSGDRPVREIAPPSPAQLKADKLETEARRLIEENEHQRATALLRQLVELTPDRAAPHALLGSTLVRGQNAAEGRAALRRAIELDPDLGTARDELARSLFHSGDLPGSEAIYRAWVEHNADSDDALFGLGQTLYARRELDGARAAFKRAARNKSSRADIRSELGLVLHAMGRLRQAEQAQRDALERDPKSGLAWFRLGTVIADAGAARRDEALEAFARALEFDPQNITARLYDYRLLRQAAADGDDTATRKAQRRMAQILTRHAAEQLPWFGLPKRPEPGAHPRRETRRLKQRALDAPDDPSAQRQLAAHLHARGDVHNAVAAYQRVLDLDPAAVGLNAQLGAAQLWLGKHVAARPFLEAATLETPADVNALRQLAWLRLLDNDTKSALAQYERVLALRPNDARAKKGRGLAWMMAGRLDEGLHAIADAGWLRR